MVFQFFVKPVHIRASVFASVSTSTSASASTSTRGRSFTNVNTVLSKQPQHLQPQKLFSRRHSIRAFTTSSASTLTSTSASFPSSYSSLFNQTVTKNHKNSDTVGNSVNSGIRINSSSVGSSVSLGSASYLGDLQNQSLRFMSSTSTSNDDDNDNDNNNDNNNNHDSKNNNDINNNNNNNINDVNKTQDTNDIPNHHPTNNDIPNHHPTNKMNKTISKQKLNDLLSELGMSISQWNIVKNMNFNTDANHNNIRNGNSNNNSTNNSSSKSNTKRKSRRRERQNTRRVSEEFDTYYNHPNVSSSSMSSSSSPSMSRNKYYKNGFGSSSLLSESVTSRLRVRSVHLAHTIDVTSVLSKIFGPMSSMPSMKHMFGKTSVIVQLPPIHDKNNTSSSSSSKSNNGNNNDHDSYFHPQAQPRFIAIFRFGSIVFFNVPTKDAASILKKVKKYSTDPISTSFERKEHFEVAISPFMEQDAHVTSDFALVKELNINNVAVISTIMAQTVAFDSYNDLVDELLSTFDDINSTVKKTGNFTSMQKETLFKVVAQNNSLFIDMIAKLGIKDRSDTAWNMSQYERIHEEMKQEFEIEGRFEHIEFKLNLIQQNAKFFLEVLHNQKSDTLEWIIIVLIGFECILMILDMSGMGQKLLTLIPS